MDADPRGAVLIINVNKVKAMINERKGTHVDADNLKKLFEQLHFDVQVYNDKDGLAATV
jgi:hypothetical protein